jgi:hypothetical protein
VRAKRRAITRMLKTNCDGNRNSIEASSTFSLCVFYVLCFFFTLCFGFVRERRKKEKKMEAKRNGREMGGRGVYI